MRIAKKGPIKNRSFQQTTSLFNQANLLFSLTKNFSFNKVSNQHLPSIILASWYWLYCSLSITYLSSCPMMVLAAIMSLIERNYMKWINPLDYLVLQTMVSWCLATLMLKMNTICVSETCFFGKFFRKLSATISWKDMYVT